MCVCACLATGLDSERDLEPVGPSAGLRDSGGVRQQDRTSNRGRLLTGTVASPRDLLSLTFSPLWPSFCAPSIPAVLMKQPYSPSADLTPDPPWQLCVCVCVFIVTVSYRSQRLLKRPLFRDSERY